jgi:hypothetical protein
LDTEARRILAFRLEVEEFRNANKGNSDTLQPSRALEITTEFFLVLDSRLPSRVSHERPGPGSAFEPTTFVCGLFAPAKTSYNRGTIFGHFEHRRFMTPWDQSR